MPLYRVLYLREGRAKAVTFQKPSPEEAEIFAQNWCAGHSDGGTWLTIRAVPPRYDPERKLLGKQGQGSAKDWAVRLMQSGDLELVKIEPA